MLANTQSDILSDLCLQSKHKDENNSSFSSSWGPSQAGTPWSFTYKEFYSYNNYTWYKQPATYLAIGNLELLIIHESIDAILKVIKVIGITD